MDHNKKHLNKNDTIYSDMDDFVVEDEVNFKQDETIH